MTAPSRRQIPVLPLALLALTVAPALAQGQVDRSAPPKPGPACPLQLPPVGAHSLANGLSGVLVDGAATVGNTIGRLGSTAGNVISANTQAGIAIFDADFTDIDGNFIGTDTTGTVNSLGNGFDGIFISNGTNSAIIPGKKNALIHTIKYPFNI